MNIYPLTREDGYIFAFEISNAYIRPRTIAEVLGHIDEVSEISLRKAFTNSSDVHLRFKYKGIDFQVWEPFGDSSRYWIGPEKENKINIDSLMSVFQSYTPSKLMKIYGDLVTFNFIKK